MPVGRSGPRRCACLLTVSLAGFWWLSPNAQAAETGPAPAIPGPALNVASLRSFQATTPSAALPVARALQRAAEVFDTRNALQRQVKDLRMQRDGLDTELTALNGELQALQEHRQQLQEQLAQTERKQADELSALRNTLEARVKDQLLQAGRQASEELNRDTQRELQTFEAQQREQVGRGLDQDLNLQARELEQLNQELEVQTRELSNRLARLQASPEAAKSLERSMRQALDKRQQELDQRRKQLEADREAAVAAQRRAMADKLQQQQVTEQHRRMTVKEASLRQSMAETLHQTRTQSEGELGYLRQAVDKAGVRQHELAERQAQIAPRAQTLERQLASATDRLQGLAGEWTQVLAQVELALQQTDLAAHPEVAAWYQQTLRYLDAGLSAELSPIPQRALTRAQQERELATQQRQLRERQLALQLAREMEEQRYEQRLAQQREQEANAKQADRLLAKADTLASHGNYDQALQTVAEAQALNPPQMARVMVARQQLLAAQERTARQATSEELERLFTRAMKVFQDGRYEEAIELFEQVIAKEGATEGSAPMLAERGR